MARSVWMAKNFSRGMTYQWKAKDFANAREYLYGVANIVIQRYNTRLLKCRNSRGIGVPEQKRDIEKTRKMLRLRVFWPPRRAPYLWPYSPVAMCRRVLALNKFWEYTVGDRCK